MAEGLTLSPTAKIRAENTPPGEIAHELYHGLDSASVDDLHIVGLCFSSLSFLASCLSIYWLVRMRRSFRHDLIILLIVSDFMKSLWLSIYDSLAIAGHRLSTDGKFCQLMGFLFAMGIEAADAAVFLIALHSTIYILWPNRAGGESGLYPYRYPAYCFFVLWPVLMASLAFVKGVPAYVNTGQSCYLPPHPWWYRTTLNWIPRYFILLTILIMYGTSYIYVRLMMRRYSRRSSETPFGRPDRLAPPTPPLILNGLVDPSPDESHPRHSSPRVPSGGAVPRLNLPPLLPRPHEERVKLRDSLRMKFDRLHPGSRIKGDWDWMGFDTEASMVCRPGSSAGVSPMGGIPIERAAVEPIWEASHEDTPRHQPQVAILKHQDRTEISNSENSSPDTSSSTSLHRLRLSFFKRRSHPDPTCPTQEPTPRGRQVADFYRRPITPNEIGGHEDRSSTRLGLGTLPGVLGRHRHLDGSQVHIRAMLRQGPHLPFHGQEDTSNGRVSTDVNGDWASASSSPVVVALDQEAFESGGISRSRDRIRRQLRLLFVYPAVYTCVWIFPFASDMTKFTSPVDAHNPFWLLIISLISLCSQGLCDAIVFCSRERPWRHMREGGFWASFDLDCTKGWHFTLRKDSGRTREEMFNDSTRARSRRDEERDRENEFRVSPGGRMPATAGGQNWWDIEVDGSSGDGQGRDQKKPQCEKRRKSSRGVDKERSNSEGGRQRQKERSNSEGGRQRQGSKDGSMSARPPFVALDGSRIAWLGTYLQP